MPNPIGRALRDRRAGHDKVAWERAGLQAPESFALTSPAFADGAPIPPQYKGRLFGQDLSPALAWTFPPAAAEELVLIVEDPDAPRSSPAVHTIARGIDPALGGLPEGALARRTPPQGVSYGRGSLGSRGWHGPMPVPSHGPHVYGPTPGGFWACCWWGARAPPTTAPAPASTAPTKTPDPRARASRGATTCHPSMRETT
jgi:phosphatidylethanolamine-binding protein (PEBP) family uncharacterized protein